MINQVSNYNFGYQSFNSYLSSRSVLKISIVAGFIFAGFAYLWKSGWFKGGEKKSGSPAVEKTIPNPDSYIPVVTVNQENYEGVFPIVGNFTSIHSIEMQRQAHEKAKVFLEQKLSEIGAIVDFIHPPHQIVPFLKDVKLDSELDSAVFVREYTHGVGEDIRKDGKRTSDVVAVYGVASQFNGSEAADKFTVLPGEAFNQYYSDGTQGPKAQSAFGKRQVELINCGGNLGFNGLCKVLTEETKATVQHGYFTPTSTQAEVVINQLREQGHLIEYLCVGNRPLEGTEIVYEILVAAPAFGHYAIPSCSTFDGQNEIEFLCALYNFRAQFAKCIDLAKKTGQSIEFKAIAPGLGVFSNAEETVAKGFYQAALEYSGELKKNRVKVFYQIFISKKSKSDQFLSYLPDQDAVSFSNRLKLLDSRAVFYEFRTSFENEVLPFYQQHEKSFDQTQIHGRLHVSRVVIWTAVMMNIYYEFRASEWDLSKTPFRAAMMCAAYDDSGRENKGPDLWEQKSRDIALKALQKEGQKDAQALANAIRKSKKDEDGLASSIELRCARQAFHSADSLDIMRPCTGHGGRGGFKAGLFDFLSDDQFTNLSAEERENLRKQLIDEAWIIIEASEKEDFKAMMQERGCKDYTLPLLELLEQQKNSIPLIYKYFKP